MHGYAGTLLFVDLSSGEIRKRPLEQSFAREYMGGSGFGSHHYLETLKTHASTHPAAVDPLGPENPFVLMTGPLTGMRLNAVARWTVGARSPLTGLWGEANIGGFFGAELKFAGYDGVVITGRSPHPCYLCITDQQVELRPADQYWGQEVYAATDALVSDLRVNQDRKGQVFTIGPAGEKLVKFASIHNHKGHVAGRTGMGAVWGAKQLKAIYVRGTGKLSVAHPEKLKQLRSTLKQVYADSITVEGLRAFGTASHIDIGVMLGDVPMHNWRLSDWELLDRIGPTTYAETLLTGPKTCYACGVMCKREAEMKAGPFQFAKGPGPEYETVAAFGTMCLNADLAAIGKANDLCNRLGLDTISCGATIAFAMECFEKGLISKTDTDGLELTWGNAAAMITMVERIGTREGFGAVLAEGSAAAARAIGGGAADFLSTVKGLEAPMHDPRAFHGFALAYATSPRGACHNASLQFPVESGGMYLPEFPELADDIDGLTSEGKARMNVITQDFGMFFSGCAGFCNLGAMVLDATQAVALVNHVTGFDYSLAEVTDLGRRIWYLKHGLSCLFGQNRTHMRLPKRLLEALSTGPTEGSVPDMERMLTEFFKLRQLDGDGRPKREVLGTMGLEGLAELLER